MLPAIDSVTESRITYSRQFQIDCMRRYLQGEKPTAIFTSAGLSPSVIGHKRIERNIARWKRDESIMEKVKQPKSSDAPVNTTPSELPEVALGKIQSLVCQVLSLNERIEELERTVEELRKGNND
ncbi:transposase [Bifidobacterium ruminantium]|jgi:hypothetical protein|uniref:transposase n=2 Tax=Bifidobacterium TaxID=1678 RepID=UPI001EF49D34|nr:transposase [Bifidobacterium ruminantium]